MKIETAREKTCEDDDVQLAYPIRMNTKGGESLSVSIYCISGVVLLLVAKFTQTSMLISSELLTVLQADMIYKTYIVFFQN